MESIKYVLYLLETELGVEPFWPIILFIAIAIRTFFPYQLRGKSETKKDKNGNTITKYYKINNLF